MSIQELEELKALEDYHEAIREEEEPCLKHYRPRRGEIHIEEKDYQIIKVIV